METEDQDRNLAGIPAEGRSGEGREPGCSRCGCALRLFVVRPGGRGGGGGADGGGGRGGGAGRDAALPAGCRAVPGLWLLLAAVRLQPARGVLGGRSGRRPQAAGRGGFLAGGRRTRRRERRGQRGPGPDGQVRAALPVVEVWEGRTRRSHHRAPSVWLQTQG